MLRFHQFYYRFGFILKEMIIGKLLLPQIHAVSFKNASSFLDVAT